MRKKSDEGCVFFAVAFAKHQKMEKHLWDSRVGIFEDNTFPREDQYPAPWYEAPMLAPPLPTTSP